jgi:hypothetical protein
MPAFPSTFTLRLLGAVLITYLGSASPISVAQVSADRSLSQFSVPLDIDQAIPVVRTAVPCSLPHLLQEVSTRVQELMTNMHQFSARERIEHTEISRKGNPHRARKTSFNYVAQINQTTSGSLSVEEFRTNTIENDAPETGLVDTGTTMFALIFHQFYIEDFEMSCEGLTEVKSRRAWQLHFSQRPNRSNLFHVYRVGNNYYPVRVKGRAWIAADNYEVLRLQTELVEPVTQIRLQREHSDIQYGPVDFPKQHIRLWLPQTAEVFMDYRGHRYQRRHTFTNFRLFTVETGERIKGLKLAKTQ